MRGLRYPVEHLLELLASGMSIEEIVEDHPDLERDDLLAAFESGGAVRRRVKFVVNGLIPDDNFVHGDRE